MQLLWKLQNTSREIYVWTYLHSFHKFELVQMIHNSDIYLCIDD